jgi:hypothetical protein
MVKRPLKYWLVNGSAALHERGDPDAVRGIDLVLPLREGER